MGRSGKRNSRNKYYILKCSKCSQDPELFGEGYFKSLKGHLLSGQLPCGCSSIPRWSKEQFAVLCSRKATQLGYTFLGFVGEWKGQNTKIKMLCEKHRTWGSGSIHSLVTSGSGCPGCKSEAMLRAAVETNTKPDEVMRQSFFTSDAFHPDTQFWRSERKNSQGAKVYWFMLCPDCGETGESQSSGLQQGCRPCACNMHRQQECYINWVMDDDTTVAIKFGIARDSNQRIKQQNSASIYTITQHSVYTFPSVRECRSAERACKKELECSIVLKRDMPDGYTETTWVYNLDKIIEIYKRNGGELI